MTTPSGTLALAAVLALAPALSAAQEEPPYWAQEGWAEGPDDAQAAAPTPPPAEAPPAPQYQGQAQPAPAPRGQWVYTQQYGWIWMPHADAYTQVPASGYGEPLAYVYAPSRGWCWLAAPWIWGIGPWPVFGVWGPARFAWYGHGWWRHPGRWHYAPAYAYWGGHRGHGYGPVHRGPAYRGPAGITRPAPHFRGGSFDRGSSAPSHGFVGRSRRDAPRASAPHAGGGAPRGGWSGGHSGGGRGGHGGGRGGGIHAGGRGGGSGHR